MTDPTTPRRVYLTGGAGFIGGAVARLLRRRANSVVAVVRDPERAADLLDIGVEVVAGDLHSMEALAGAMRGCDAVVHAAGSYRVGIPVSERPAMLDANVGSTARVLDAAIEAGVPRIVYVSTGNVFGNTNGRIVDESFRRDLHQPFLSYYDETKYQAHVLARERAQAGAPVIIAMPSQTYGPGDHSDVGAALRAAHDGRLRYRVLETVGLSLVHVDDVAGGIVAALDRGRVRESYILGGPNLRLADALDLAARLGGHVPPRLRVSTSLLRAAARLPAGIAQAAGLPPNLGEVISAADGVTYWLSSGRASRELGYAPRGIEGGLRDTFDVR
ncbi:MAG: NAD-dependent epimerase/dehydratase family protein [Chloroflexota bacterium]